MVDTYSEEWKLICLARHVLQRSYSDQNKFMRDWRKKHGDASADRVQRYINQEKKRRRR